MKIPLQDSNSTLIITCEKTIITDLNYSFFYKLTVYCSLYIKPLLCFKHILVFSICSRNHGFYIFCKYCVIYTHTYIIISKTVSTCKHVTINYLCNRMVICILKFCNMYKPLINPEFYKCYEIFVGK